MALALVQFLIEGLDLVCGSVFIREEAVCIVFDVLGVTVDLSSVPPSPNLVCFFSFAGRQETA